MERISVLPVALFALILGAQPVAGQALDHPDMVEVLSQADADGEFLRIVTVDSLRIEGYIRGLDDRVIQLGGGEAELRLIERVELRSHQGRGSKSGAVIGAVVVGGAFGLAGLLVAGLCRYDCGVTTQLTPLIGAAAGATIGAILGSALGGAAAPGETEWTLLWSR